MFGDNLVSSSCKPIFIQWIVTGSRDGVLSMILPFVVRSVIFPSTPLRDTADG